MISFVFRYMNPLWWAYFTVLKVPWLLIKFVFNLPLWIYRRCTSWWSKLLFGSAALWVAIPGTVPLTLYWIAGALGFKEEADVVVDWAIAMAQFTWTVAKVTYSVANAMMA